MKKTLKDFGFKITLVEIFDNHTGDLHISNGDLALAIDLKTCEIAVESAKSDDVLSEFFNITNLKDYSAYNDGLHWYIYEPAHPNCNTATKEPDIDDYDLYTLEDTEFQLCESAKLELLVMLSMFLTESVIRALK